MHILHERTQLYKKQDTDKYMHHIRTKYVRNITIYKKYSKTKTHTP
jgi:hypothetical protein